MKSSTSAAPATRSASAPIDLLDKNVGTEPDRDLPRGVEDGEECQREAARRQHEIRCEPIEQVEDRRAVQHAQAFERIPVGPDVERQHGPEPGDEARDGGYRGQMAVYVKPNGVLGRLYMAAIRPFRHLGVYPPMLRQLGREWRARAAEPAPAA